MTTQGAKIEWLKPDGSFFTEKASVGDEDARGKKTGLVILVDRDSYFDWPNPTEIPRVTLADLQSMDTPPSLLGFHKRVALAAFNSPFPIKGRGIGVDSVTEESMEAYYDTHDMRAVHETDRKDANAEKMTMAMMLGLIGFIMLAGATASLLVISRLGS